MRVTTVRLRPLRRATAEDVGLDRENAAGRACAELWVKGDLWAIIAIPSESSPEVIWGTPFAKEHEAAICELAKVSGVLMEGAMRQYGGVA